jgi:outer membrane protein
MKKIVLTLSALILSMGVGLAQKYAFVDTEYILSNIPTYKAAQDQLDQLSKEWEEEISAMYAEVEKMYRDYQSEEVLLTQEMKRKRELIKPIQDEVYNAVKEIAVEGNYAVIFDTSSGPSLLYTNPRYDLSDDVLEKLGYKN